MHRSMAGVTFPLHAPKLHHRAIPRSKRATACFRLILLRLICWCPNTALLFGVMGWWGTLQRCHQALEVAILVNGLAIFISLGSFESNELFANGTNRKRWQGGSHVPNLLTKWGLDYIIFSDIAR